MLVLDLVVDFSEVRDEVCVVSWSSVDAKEDVVRCCFLLELSGKVCSSTSLAWLMLWVVTTL